MKPELTKWLNLCRKAGAVATGADAVKKALKTQKAHLTLTANDAGAISRDVGPHTATDLTKEELGLLTGRRETSVLAITNKELALKLKEILNI